MAAFKFSGAGIIKAYRIITAAALVLWMALIFSLSSQNAALSSGTSGGVIRLIAGIFCPGFDNLSAAEQTEIVSSMQFIARKSAHFCIYTVLGILSFLTFISYEKLKFVLRLAVSGAVCLLYAASDEFHQLFVPGRSGEVRDVMIDFSGAMLGIAMSALIFLLIGRIKKKRTCKNEKRKIRN